MQRTKPWLNITLLISLTTALIYVSGWTFAYEYFSLFRIGLLSLEISTEYFFMYGFWVLKANAPWLGLAYLFGLLLWFWPPGHKPEYVQVIMPVIKALLPIGVAVLFVLFYLLGDQLARDKFTEQQIGDYPSYPAVKIGLKTDNNSPAKLAEGLSTGCYRLLVQNKDKIFVFRPRRSLPGELAVTALPQKVIESMRILPIYQSCE
jgi:hypothetical protein